MSPLPQRVLTLVALGASVACNNGPAGQIVTSTAIEPGEDCAAGGVLLVFGTDADEDGALTGDEIASEQILCSGESPEVQDGTLLSSSPVAPGDDCLYGGTLFEAGTDNGDGGGTAGDGILQAGEVDTSQIVCAGPPNTALELEAPGGAAGTDQIVARGGDGVACGAEGGTVILGSGNALNGSVRGFTTGAADTAFTVPTPTVDLGDRPLEVTSDLTLARLADSNCDGTPDTAPAEGAFFAVDCSGPSARRIYQWASGSPERVTGLRVAAGATLTLTPNTDSNYNGLDLVHDLHLQGTLTTSPADNRLYAEVGRFVGEAGSTVLGAGWNVNLRSESHIVSATTWSLAGTEGLDGGKVSLSAQYSLFNTGTVNAAGGTVSQTSTATGGDGGEAWFHSDSGGVFNSGDVDVSGGTGTLYGGDGGTFWAYGALAVVNSGSVDARPGDANAACATARGDTGCPGGDPDFEFSIDWRSPYGSVRTSGQILTTGGTSYLTEGGTGGGILLMANSQSEGTGSIELSGTLDLSGGSGDTGGEAGPLHVWVGSTGLTRGHISLYGYERIDLSGGDTTNGGACDAGNGGLLEVDAPCGSGIEPGGIVFEPDLYLDGGSGPHAGWAGGALFTHCDQGGPQRRAPSLPDQFAHSVQTDLVLRGDIHASGGHASVGGGRSGGYVGLDSLGGVVIEGDVTMLGGDGAEGGNGGYLEVQSTGRPAKVSGAIALDGGSGRVDASTPEGGWGGTLEVMSFSAIAVSGSLSATGGPGFTGRGGPGGEVRLSSSAGLDLTSTTDLAGGTGTPAGEDGLVYLNGVPD